MESCPVESVSDEDGKGRGGGGWIGGGWRREVGACEKMCDKMGTNFRGLFVAIVWVRLLKKVVYKNRKIKKKWRWC